MNDEKKMEQQSRALLRLARLVLRGDVVFFIGAGFSIDAEGNSAKRMMRRLVVRLLGFVYSGSDADKKRAGDLFKDFVDKFNLDPGGLLGQAKDERAARIRWLTIGGLPRGQDGGSDETRLADDVFEVEPVLRELQLNSSTAALLRRLMCALGEWPINRLAREYYEVNDWFCRAFEALLQESTAHRLQQVHETEQDLFLEMNQVLEKLKEKDSAPLPPIRPWLALTDAEAGRSIDPRMAGKALFLETLGFSDINVMGGSTSEATLVRVAASFHERLLPRHHVLARFAREGWCPTLITTNFDLLIEGAYQLAGFARREQPQSGFQSDEFPQTLISGFEVAASASEFFRKAKAFRTAVVVKIHGCASRYRMLIEAYEEARKERPEASGADKGESLTLIRNEDSKLMELEECIRSMVFTYREIQNWRGDTWAADYLRTVLRTRTVVFCGYSVRDPVIHDTFRGAFEEMARVNRLRTTFDPAKTNPVAPSPDEPAGAAGESEKRPGEEAPLYFIGSEGDRSFHSEAVLNAATEAVGGTAPRIEDYPNRIAFYYRGGTFPDLDEVFLWLQHLTRRERQRECLDGELARVTAQLSSGDTFRQKRGSELDAVMKRFTTRFELERKPKGESPFSYPLSSADARRRFERHTSWTERFHGALLREFACAEYVRRLRMPTLQLATMRYHEWYFPAMENPAWTCWATVVELALLAAAQELRCAITVADSSRPTVFLRPTSPSVRLTPWAITIEFAGAERLAASMPILGTPTQRVIWELRVEDAPWPLVDASGDAADSQKKQTIFSGSDHVIRRPAPSGRVIWELAAGTNNKRVWDAFCVPEDALVPQEH